MTTHEHHTSLIARRYRRGVHATIILAATGIAATTFAVSAASSDAAAGCSTRPTVGEPFTKARADAAKFVGCALRGNGDFTVSLADAEALGNAIPAHAQIDKANHTVRFTSHTVRFTVVASPPTSDMKYRIAGLNNPTIIIPKGAHVTVEFINGDSDEAHMWVLYPITTNKPMRGSGAAARPLGDPTSNGQPAETISFTLNHAGTYEYLCGFPGHYEQGMHGSLIVAS